MSNSIQTLFSAETIHKRVCELGKQITQDYQGKEIVVVGVLTGAFIFMADLVREIQLPLQCEFIRISSYGDKKVSSGKVQIVMDLPKNKIQGKHILIVEDIVDTGNSIVFLQNHLSQHNPASLKICSLLLKEATLQHSVNIDYLGFKIDPVFIIGYGLDLAGKYRNLPEIGVHP